MFSNGYDIASSLENMELTDILPDNPPESDIYKGICYLIYFEQMGLDLEFEENSSNF